MTSSWLINTEWFTPSCSVADYLSSTQRRAGTSVRPTRCVPGLREATRETAGNIADDHAAEKAPSALAEPR
jgi:hypothetical protein